MGCRTYSVPAVEDDIPIQRSEQDDADVSSQRSEQDDETDRYYDGSKEFYVETEVWHQLQAAAETTFRKHAVSTRGLPAHLIHAAVNEHGPLTHISKKRAKQ